MKFDFKINVFGGDVSGGEVHASLVSMPGDHVVAYGEGPTPRDATTAMLKNLEEQLTDIRAKLQEVDLL